MNKNINKIIVLSSLMLVLVLANGCAPRGETQSMSDLLTQARDRFRTAELKMGESPLKSTISDVAQKLVSIEKIQDPIALKPATGEIKEALTTLLEHAGYTVRPSFAELVAQYRAIANGSSVTTDSSLAGSPEIRLLLVRTYSILASELETGKFSL